MSVTERLSDDRGSAVVDFTLTSVLLLFVFLAVFQLGLALHVRNTLIDAAAAGARYASLADRTDADGAERTRAIITDAVGAGYAQNITVSRTGVGELPAIEVHVVAPLPVVATLGPADALEVSGHAVDMDA